MPKSTFVGFVLDQLSDVGGVTCLPMFGGHGLYHRRVFFGIVYKDRLYFRTDARTRADYEAHAMRPFRPNPRQTLSSYYEVPADVVEDRYQMRVWARRAISTARAPARRKGQGEKER